MKSGRLSYTRHEIQNDAEVPSLPASMERFRTAPPEQGCKCNIFCFFFPTFASLSNRQSAALPPGSDLVTYQSMLPRPHPRRPCISPVLTSWSEYPALRKKSHPSLSKTLGEKEAVVGSPALNPASAEKPTTDNIMTAIRPPRIGLVGIAQGKTDKNHTGM